MALQKDFTDKFDNTSNYHRINVCNFDARSQTGVARIDSYKNRSAFIAGKQCVDTCVILIGATEIVESDVLKRIQWSSLAALDLVSVQDKVKLHKIHLDESNQDLDMTSATIVDD